MLEARPAPAQADSFAVVSNTHNPGPSSTIVAVATPWTMAAPSRTTTVNRTTHCARLSQISIPTLASNTPPTTFPDRSTHHAQQRHLGDRSIVFVGDQPAGHGRPSPDLHEACRNAMHSRPGVAVAIDRLTAAPPRGANLADRRKLRTNRHRVVLRRTIDASGIVSGLIGSARVERAGCPDQHRSGSHRRRPDRGARRQVRGLRRLAEGCALRPVGHHAGRGHPRSRWGLLRRPL